MKKKVIFWPVRKIAKTDCYLRHVCPSVRLPFRMEKLGFHLTDFHEIRHLSTWKFVEKIQVSLQSDNKVNMHFFYYITLNSS